MVPLKVPLGSGHKTSGCRRCGEVFTSLGGFDRHRSQRRGVCVPPASVGLVQHANGRWSFPDRVREAEPLPVYEFTSDEE